MSNGAQLLDGVLDVGAEASEHGALFRAIELLAGEREVNSQRHQALLRAVVEVALDAPPFGVAGLEYPRP